MKREELVALIKERYDYIPLELWGTKGTKTVDSLIQEISDGEAALTELDPQFVRDDVEGLVRVIKTVLIRVYVDLPQEDGLPKRLQLVELKREKGGVWLPRSKSGGQHLSEKIRYLREPPETPEECALRCFDEELELRHRESGQLLSGQELAKMLSFAPGPPIAELTGSHRYPGLITRNFMHRGECLLDAAYYRPEYKERDASGNVVGVFRWRGVAVEDAPVPVLYG